MLKLRSLGVDLAELTAAVRQFADERDWHQFHTPKNLAISVAVEAGELLELVQWKTDAEIGGGLAAHDEWRRSFADEMADVLIYLVRLGDVTGIDLLAAAESKLEANAERYTVESSRSSSAKHPR